MNYKKLFIPCIYLKDGKAMTDMTGNAVLYDSAVEAASIFSDSGADEILVFDLSEADNDKAHDAAMDCLKDICKASDVPVIGAGNVKRMEDIKKLLYAGCKRACLDYTDGLNTEITEEVSEKFGKEKILITFSDKFDILADIEKVKKYSTELVCLTGKAKEFSLDIDLPVINVLQDNYDDDIFKLLQNNKISGISGPFLNGNIDLF